MIRPTDNGDGTMSMRVSKVTHPTPSLMKLIGHKDEVDIPLTLMLEDFWRADVTFTRDDAPRGTMYAKFYDSEGSLLFRSSIHIDYEVSETVYNNIYKDEV